MSSDYSFAKPDVPLDEGISSFLSEFYRISDDPDGHELYEQQFTADASFTIGSKKTRGTEEIRALRKTMWAQVATRKHKVHRVFAAAGSSEVMLYGDVAQTLKSGAEIVKEWAARGVLEKSVEDGKWRFAFYQVYLDMST